MRDYSTRRFIAAVIVIKVAWAFAATSPGFAQQEIEPPPPIVACDTDSDCAEKNGGEY